MAEALLYMTRTIVFLLSLLAVLGPTARAHAQTLPDDHAQAVAQLGRDAGPAFDARFLARLLREAQATIETAVLVESGAVRPEVRELARSVEASARRDVARIESLQRAQARGGSNGQRAMGGGPPSTDARALVGLRDDALERTGLQVLVAQHQRTIELARLAPSRTRDPAVATLANESLLSHQREGDLLRAQLERFYNAPADARIASRHALSWGTMGAIALASVIALGLAFALFSRGVRGLFRDEGRTRTA